MNAVLFMLRVPRRYRFLVPIRAIVIVEVNLLAEFIQTVDLMEHVDLCEILAMAEAPTQRCFNAQMWRLP